MPGPKSDKIWADAIRRAVHEYHSQKDANGKIKKTRHLNALATNLVKQGLKGDVQAIREIGDRLDGKPRQEAEIQQTVHDYRYVVALPEEAASTEEWTEQQAPQTLQ